jgi:hypothetical protein
MKADSNFNLSKPIKKILATILDKEERRLFKNAMISAELDYAAAKKKALTSKKEKEAA